MASDDRLPQLLPSPDEVLLLVYHDPVGRGVVEPKHPKAVGDLIESRSSRTVSSLRQTRSEAIFAVSFSAPES